MPGLLIANSYDVFLTQRNAKVRGVFTSHNWGFEIFDSSKYHQQSKVSKL